MAFARKALEAGLEKVFFLVEPRPRRKQGVRAFEHRVAMVQLAIRNESRFGAILLEQARFTPHETLPVLKERFHGYELVFLFGDDVMGYMVDHIAAWPHIDELAKSASLLIAARNQQQTELDRKLGLLRKHHDLPFKYGFVEPGVETLSSSKIRLAIKRKETVTGLPQSVLEYIRKNNLYVADEIIS